MRLASVFERCRFCSALRIAPGQVVLAPAPAPVQKLTQGGRWRTAVSPPQRANRNAAVARRRWWRIGQVYRSSLQEAQLRVIDRRDTAWKAAHGGRRGARRGEGAELVQTMTMAVGKVRCHDLVADTRPRNGRLAGRCFRGTDAVPISTRSTQLQLITLTCVPPPTVAAAWVLWTRSTARSQQSFNSVEESRGREF